MGNIETTVLEFFDIYGRDSAYFSRDASSPDISSMTYRTIIDTTGFLSISHSVVRKKDYVLVDDVINTLVSTIQRGGFKGSVQIGSGHTIDLQYVTDYTADLTQRCLNKNITMEFDINLDIFPVQGAANIERSHHALSWAPRTPLKLGIAKNYVRDMARRNDTRDKHSCSMPVAWTILSLRRKMSFLILQ